MKSSVLTSKPVLSSAPRHAAYTLWERACSRKPPTNLPQTSPAMAASSLLDLRLLTQTDAQFAQRLGIYRTRGLSHDTGGALGFREGNHFTDRLRTGHQHDQTVQTEGETTMRRRTVFQRIKQEAELLLLLIGADTQNIEHHLLHFLAVDTNGAATQFGAIEHHVVGTGQRRPRIGLQLFRRAFRRGERVMQRAQAAIVVLFEHREIHYPQRCPFAGEQLQVMPQTNTQRAQRLGDDLRLVGTEEHDVTIYRANTIQNDVEIVLGDELDDRRLQTLDALGALVDLDVGQALGAVDTDELGVVVDLLARHGGAARYAQRGNAALGIIGRATEHLEVDFSQLVSNIYQFQRDAQIRLVRTVAAHGFFEGHVRELAQIQVQHFLEQTADHALGQPHDVLFIEKAGLDVDLGKFRLAVGTQIFVTEALGDLVVTIKTGHHQQLLEQLGRLRQGEEIAGMGTARHQIVASTFRRSTGQDRRFHIQEAVVVQVAADAAGDTRAQLQLGGHFRPAQVDEAVTQAGLLANVGIFVQREWRGIGLIQYFQLIAQHLDGAGGHVRVDRAGRARAHLATHLDHILAAHPISQREGIFTVR